ncbi:partial Vitamin B12 transporter BtuB, partial [Anaerolineae bacterium]
MRASLASLAMGAITTAAAAQETRPDSIRPVPLSAIVISAERSATPMNRTTAAVSRLTADDIERLPQATLADVLRHVPGVAVVDFDGLGKDPQLMVRGFYGGGESEYVVVMVDGLVVNRVHNGTLAWDALPPPAAIASIEVMRGSGSTVAGDAAVAAVVSIRTRPAAERRVAWNVSGGGFGSFDAALDLGGSLAGRGMRLDASADRTEGFRAHAAREGRRLAASVEMTPAWQLSVNAATRRFDEPGPLLESALATNRSASDPMFRFDETEDAELTVGVRHQRSLGSGQVSATATLDRRNATILRTLPLAPGFGDTKERALGTRRAALELQADFGDSGLPGDDHLTIGGRLDVGDLASRYY